jgi:carboxylesterase 2
VNDANPIPGVKQLLANPPSPLPYRAAIMQSEASATGNGTVSWTRLLTLLNCTSLTGPSALACARAAPASTIKNIIETSSLVFPPVADSVTSSANVAQQLNAKTFAHVPFTADGLATLAPAIEASYPTPQTPTAAFEEISDIITDVTFQCPAMTLANTAVANGYKDVWRYYYNASFPNSTPFPDAGVFHSSEIPEVFGTYNATGATAQQIAVSKYMQTAWATFAKDPSNGPGWPKWQSEVKDLADIGGNGNNGEFEIDPNTVDQRCAIYAPVYALTGI